MVGESCWRIQLTLGSLFDGIGGFPLAAVMNGITPVWASEIEPAPISITKNRFPEMKHLGDIIKIDGSEIEPVDIITFGSPCQDLSVAGKREGIEGERSGLFMEAIRIIEEMRYATNRIQPRFAVWENVPGAFSSNNGEDFRFVLQEIANIGKDGISIPRPPARGGNPGAVWEYAGAIVGDCWSLAWRVLDAKYWGVPQRRRRIFLVADFGGERAAEILFKPGCLPGDIAEGGAQGQGASGNAERSVRAAGFNGWRSVTGTVEYQEEKSPCIQANMPPNAVIGIDGYNQNLTGNIAQAIRGGRPDGDNVGMVILENHPADSRIKISEDGIAQTLSSRMGTGGGNAPMVMAVHQNQCGEARINEAANTLSTNGNASGRNAPLVFALEGNASRPSHLGLGVKENISFALNTVDRHAIAYDCRNHTVNNEVSGTLQAKENGGQSLNYINPIATFAMQGFGDYKKTEKASTLKSRDSKDSTDLISQGYTVRRLTPMECERLQGFPDGWTEYGVNEKNVSRHDNFLEWVKTPAENKLIKISDSARYKALGNSVAIPCVFFIIKRIKEALQYETSND